MASESKPSTKPPFLRLPAEIRNQIFVLALVEDEAIYITTRTDGLRSYAHPLSPALTRVCRQTREEAIPIYYGANTFKFDYLSVCLKWYDELSSPDAAKHVRKIILLESYGIAPFHDIFSHRDIQTTLALDSKRSVKVYYSNCPKARDGVCTCPLEAAASRLTRTIHLSPNNPLFTFASKVADGFDELAEYRRKRAKLRSDSCSCGMIVES